MRSLGFFFLCFHTLFDRRLIIICRLALNDMDRVGRTGRQTVSESVAVIILDQFRLAVYHGDRTLVTGICAGSTSVA